jgi:hypothetical protein
MKNNEEVKKLFPVSMNRDDYEIFIGWGITRDNEERYLKTHQTFIKKLGNKRNGLTIQYNRNGQPIKVSNYVNNKKQGLEFRFGLDKNYQLKMDIFFYVEGKEEEKSEEKYSKVERWKTEWMVLMEKYGYNDKNNKNDDSYNTNLFRYDCWEQYLEIIRTPFVREHFDFLYDTFENVKNGWEKYVLKDKQEEEQQLKCG